MADEKLNVDQNHIKVDENGHITITDPKVLEKLKQKAPFNKAGPQPNVSVGVVVGT